jgi:hypothetical protein
MGINFACSSICKLSSEGSLSDPPDESPSPAAINYLSYISSYSKIEAS